MFPACHPYAASTTIAIDDRRLVRRGEQRADAVGIGN
jgi:hypothetical protein